MQQTAGIWVLHFLNGLTFSMLLFLVAAGLSLIFGLMDVLNLAHGAFYMLGAYIGLSTLKLTGNFWISMGVAPLMCGALGFLVERFLIRPMYKRSHLDQVLVSIGLALIVGDTARSVWGADIRSVSPPPELRGAISIMGNSFPVYRLFVCIFGAAIAVLLLYSLGHTRWGAVVRAGVSDREMTRNMGIAIEQIFAASFALGCALAGLAGVVAAPIMAISPGMDSEVLILALMVVVVGGMGTLSGPLFGSLLIGEADTFGKALLPQFSMFLIFLVMAWVLLYRPTGLAGRKDL